jgi:P pilus assembly chaperone PapD
MKYIHSFLICLILLFFFTAPSHAEVRLIVAPSFADIVIKPGKKADVSFTIQNMGDPTIITPSVQAFRTDDFIGEIKLVACH